MAALGLITSLDDMRWLPVMLLSIFGLPILTWNVLRAHAQLGSLYAFWGCFARQCRFRTPVGATVVAAGLLHYRWLRALIAPSMLHVLRRTAAVDDRCSTERIRGMCRCLGYPFCTVRVLVLLVYPHGLVRASTRLTALAATPLQPVVTPVLCPPAVTLSTAPTARPPMSSAAEVPSSPSRIPPIAGASGHAVNSHRYASAYGGADGRSGGGGSADSQRGSSTAPVNHGRLVAMMRRASLLITLPSHAPAPFREILPIGAAR